MIKERAFKLPDNSYFSYYLIDKIKGKNEYEERAKSSIYPRFLKQLNIEVNSDTKRFLPALDTLSNRNFSLVPVDIDDLALVWKAYGKCVNWSDVQIILTNECPDACVFLSASKKPKAMFLVSGRLDVDSQIAFLKSKVSPELFSCLDLKERALRRCFVSQIGFDTLSSWLSNDPMVCEFKELDSFNSLCIDMCREENRDTVENRDKDRELYKYYNTMYVSPNGPTKTKKEMWKPYAGKIELGLTEHQNKALSFFLGSSFLFITKGIATSQKWLGDFIGINQRNTSLLLKKLHVKGLIYKVSGHIAGKKGITWKPSGALLDLANKINKEQMLERGQDITKAITVYDLPQEILDGKWHETLWETAKKCGKNEELYLSWLYSRDGYSEKDREAQAKAIWKTHIKNINTYTNKDK